LLDQLSDALATVLSAPRTLEERLRESEERFRGMFEEAPVACHEINHEGVVIRVNRAECELLGFVAEKMVGRPIWEFMAVEEEKEGSREAVRRKISGEQALTRFEREYTRSDGATRIVEIYPTLIRDGAGRGIGIRSFLLDVTARKQAERALKKQAEELAHSNAELEQFASIASHDLQEPLRKILAFADRLKTKSADTLNPEGREYLARVQNAASRMQNLIHDLLSLSRVATHTQPFAAVDLAEFVRTVLSDLESRLVSSGGRVEVGPLPILVADRGQMAQLLQNLIGNGLKFHKTGEVPVVQIHGQAVPGSPDFCAIVVEDNGVGFEQKYADRIFRVFERLHSRSEYDGTGIGLAICRKIVDRHGGSIAATSNPGDGAKFTVTLPYRPSTKETHA
jgi:two-component system, LuxR family, sensor kinase FixL